MSKTKILLDADVIIHFSVAGKLSFLPAILDEYEHIVLSKVFEELRKTERTCINNMEQTFHNISVHKFAPQGAMLQEYACLLATRGKGESACMAYCKFNKDIIGSSNLKDIHDYCLSNNITYLTTFDFLYFAIQRNKMSIAEARQFVCDVKANGSKLPDKDIATYVSSVVI